MEYLAILVSAIAGMAVGFLWYGPIFGKVWVKLSGFTPEMMAAAQERGMRREYALSFVGLLITATVLYYFVVVPGLTMIQAVSLVFVAWLGFIAPTMMNSVLWEGKSYKLYALNVLERLVTLLIIAKILVLFG